MATTAEHTTGIRFYDEYKDRYAKECIAEALLHYNMAKILRDIVTDYNFNGERRATLEIMIKQEREKAEGEHRTANRLEKFYRHPILGKFTIWHNKFDDFGNRLYENILRATGQLK